MAESVAHDPISDSAARRRLLWLMTRLLPAVIGGIAISATILPDNVTYYLAPTLASIGVFLIFSLILYLQVGENVFGEIGFVYLGLAVAYTVLPALAFMLAGLDESGALALLLPDPDKLYTHLWRHVLFEIAVAVGYLVVRGRRASTVHVAADPTDRDSRTVVVVGAFIAICIASMILMSAPVESYYDHYIRYDHLSWAPRKLISVAIRLSLGLYAVLLVFLFRGYTKFKLLIPLAVLAIVGYEMAYSFGARIQALIVLLQVVCLYHFLVKPITLKVGFLAALSMATLFSVVEVVRQFQGDVGAGLTTVSQEGLRPASEFIAVYYPGFHLYQERAQGTLPSVEWPMFFHDFISLFTFGDFTRWNPMNWYANNYFPDAEVPPWTLGPMADSAIWGGELDLVVRALINGIFFALIMRWFLRYKGTWWGLTVYAYCYATCILTLKYSVFLHLNLIEKNLLPTLLLVAGVRALMSTKPSRAVPRLEAG